MSRELKFRVWNVGTGFMRSMSWYELYLQDGILYEESENKFGLSEVLPTKSQYILMQYTGLNDCMGNEIYEGDCINTPNNIVEFCNGCFCINGDTPLSVMVTSGVVIGNKYEGVK